MHIRRSSEKWFKVHRYHLSGRRRRLRTDVHTSIDRSCVTTTIIRRKISGYTSGGTGEGGIFSIDDPRVASLHGLVGTSFPGLIHFRLDARTLGSAMRNHANCRNNISTGWAVSNSLARRSVSINPLFYTRNRSLLFARTFVFVNESLAASISLSLSRLTKFRMQDSFSSIFLGSPCASRIFFSSRPSVNRVF